MAMTLAGIVFGVGFFIITQAQTSGFENFFIRAILGVNGAIRVQDKLQDTMRSMDAEGPNGSSGFQVKVTDGKKYVSGVPYPKEVATAARKFQEVIGVSEVLQGSAIMHGNFREMDCKPYGIQLDDHLTVSDLGNQIVLGDLKDFRQNRYGVLIGRPLANKMDVTVGTPVTVQASGATMPFRISAIYETGIEQIDRSRVFIHLPAARSLFQRPYGASFLQVSLVDPHRANDLSAHMTQVLQHHVASWQERERSWLEVFRALKVSAGVTVSIIIFISGLGMFSTLAITVMEKTKDIAILRSIGYTQSDISQIFLLQGLTVLVVGVITGWIFAASVTYGVTKVPIRIRGIFSTDSFVVDWSIWHYIISAVIAGFVVLLASWFPARRAAKVEPADIIRGTGG